MESMSIQSAIPKSVYLFIGISVAFALFALASDLVFFSIFFGFFELPLIEPQVESLNFLGFPVICSWMGFTFGIVAKAKIREHVDFSEQGCLADTLIYANVVIFVVNIISLFLLAYFLGQVLA